MAHKSFDPEQSDDPVAQKTEWSSLRGGGANFGTHKLVARGENKMVFRGTLGANLFCMAFIAIGALTIFGTFSCLEAVKNMELEEEVMGEGDDESARLGGLPSEEASKAESDESESTGWTFEDRPEMNSERGDESAGESDAEAQSEESVSRTSSPEEPEFDESALWIVAIVPFGFGAIFLLSGVFFLYSATRPATFDKNRGLYWRGWLPPGDASVGSSARSAKLDEIHAIQLIEESIRGSGRGGSYTSYEINLVMNDGKRVNVVDHGNEERIREDVAKLAEFLGKPLWDTL